MHAYERTYPTYNYKVDQCGMRWLVMGDGGNIEGLYKTFAAQPNTCPCTPVNNDTYSNGCPCQDVSPSTLSAVRTDATQPLSAGCLFCVLLARGLAADASSQTGWQSKALTPCIRSDACAETSLIIAQGIWTCSGLFL